MKKLLIALLLVLTSSLVFAAYERREDIVTYRAATGAVYTLPGATITVYNSDRVTLATLYINSTGSPLSNPLTADSSGRYFYYIAPGVYNEKIVKSGYTTQWLYDIPRGTDGLTGTVQSAFTGTCPTGAISSVTSTGGVSCSLTNVDNTSDLAKFLNTALTGTTTVEILQAETQGVAFFVSGYSSLNAANTAALLIPNSVIISDWNTSLSSNLTITIPVIHQGGLISCGTYTMNITSLQAAQTQVFDSSCGVGDISGLSEANILWFGAKSIFLSGYSTFDSSTAINTASASFGNHGILHFPKGKFRIDSMLSKKPGVRWVGIGGDFDDITDETEEWVGSTLFWSSPTGTLVEVPGGVTVVTAERQGNGSYWHGGFEHLSFKADWSIMVDAVAISFPGSKKEWVKDCDIRYFGTGIKAYYYDDSYPGELYIKDTYLGFMKFASIDWYKTVDSLIDNSKFGGNYYGLYMDNCTSNKMTKSRPQNGQVAGVYINNSRNFEIVNNEIDTNGDATHTADGVIVKDSNDISFIANRIYDNTGNGVVVQNSHECKFIGNSFGRHGQVGPINSSGIVFVSDSSDGVSSGDTFRMTVMGNHFTVDDYYRTFTGRGTLERGILVTNGTLTTDFVRQLSIIGNDFFTATALHLENGDVVPGNTSNLTTGIFDNNNVTGVTDVIKNPLQLSTNEFQYSRDRQVPMPSPIITKGDEGMTVNLYNGDARVYQFASPLTTTQTVTLESNGPLGSTVEIFRVAASTGSSPLTIKSESGTLENLGTFQWMKAMRTGTSWARIAGGSLTPVFTTTTTWNPGLIPGGTCVTRDVTVVNATVGSAVVTSPVTTSPGNGVEWNGSYVSAASVVTQRLCALVSDVTPSVTTYKITVLK